MRWAPFAAAAAALLRVEGFVCTMTSQMSKPTLLDMPVSNAGARVRYIIYEKGLEQEVDIVPPSEFGGLKSEEYLKINPQGKMPAFIDGDMTFGESDVIARHLLDKYADVGPSFTAPTLQERTRANAIARQHDVYIMTITGCMYKAAPPFGVHARRLDALADLRKQLDVLEDMACSSGPFLAGADLSLADAACFPTLVFCKYMLPKFGWAEGEILGPKLTRWWQLVCASKTGARVKEEIEGALRPWDERGRWDTILHAGARDAAPETIFDRILRKEIPSTVVHEDAYVLAFRDINPVAPSHVLIIPKVREGLTQLRFATADHAFVLGKMLEAAAKIAADEKLEGFRLVINDGPKGGQEVYHLHMHLIGGRTMKWPPG
ncbi:glutathione s-transferase [Tribonema minus]|uniref:Glutathione s-transferase n=1 Tax=Tribonema minus TaxID=303371 RepID=A0A835YG69_9STRA|nr:glutathione s-transferase [Tribonema minus]